jgi:hypothetical protein
LPARLCRNHVGLPAVLASLWATSLLTLRIGSLGWRMLVGVGNINIVAALADVVCFPSNQFGHASARVGVLGLVRPSWCHRSSIIVSSSFGSSRGLAS